jgi:Lrp/AsnC family transcriptional regulator, leucine-responsive regulatory protein
VPEPIQALNDTDRAIIDLLAENARRTLGDIGTRVGLSAPAVKRRIDRLEAAGVILGYTTRVDHAKLGRPLEAFTELRFSGDARVDAIASIGADIPEVEAVFTIAGDPDALAWIRVSDVHELKRVIDRLRGTGEVIGTKTLMVLGTSAPKRPDGRAKPAARPSRARHRRT